MRWSSTQRLRQLTSTLAAHDDRNPAAHRRVKVYSHGGSHGDVPFRSSFGGIAETALIAALRARRPQTPAGRCTLLPERDIEHPQNSSILNFVYRVASARLMESLAIAAVSLSRPVSLGRIWARGSCEIVARKPEVCERRRAVAAPELTAHAYGSGITGSGRTAAGGAQSPA
jgi:hypothetical protein